jgi:hypothetical protein
MRRISLRRLQEGERSPWGWGMAWPEVDRFCYVIMPLPFNWLVAWVVAAYWWLVWPHTPDRRSQVYRAGYDKGRRDAERGARLEVEQAWRKGYEDAFGLMYKMAGLDGGPGGERRERC